MGVAKFDGVRGQASQAAELLDFGIAVSKFFQKYVEFVGNGVGFAQQSKPGFEKFFSCLLPVKAESLISHRSIRQNAQSREVPFG